MAQFPVAPRDWTEELAALRGRLHAGTSRVSTDRPETGGIRQDMVGLVTDLMRSTQRELLIVNAYIIPGDASIDMLRELQGRAAKVRVVTNSLASHDVPAVNSHYKKWRRPMLEAGVELHAIRHDTAMRSEVADTAPIHAKFMGLHAKGMVIDRERVWIGSMNVDPRSAGINTEMGVVIESRGLAEALARLIERDLEPANSWHVKLDDAGGLTWTNDRETVTRQPARSFRQRVEDVVFMAFPKELY